MVEIAMYRCSDKKCRREVRLTRGAPVWHPDTPRELRAFTVRPEAEKFVLRYRTESFCSACKKLVETEEANICPLCHTESAFDEQTNRRCPECGRGFFEMNLLLVR